MNPSTFYATLAGWFPRRVRLWLYAVAVATLLFFVVKNVIDQDTADALAGLVYALLFGVAIKNVPSPEDDAQ